MGRVGRRACRGRRRRHRRRQAGARGRGRGRESPWVSLCLDGAREKTRRDFGGLSQSVRERRERSEVIGLCLLFFNRFGKMGLGLVLGLEVYFCQCQGQTKVNGSFFPLANVRCLEIAVCGSTPHPSAELV